MSEEKAVEELENEISSGGEAAAPDLKGAQTSPGPAKLPASTGSGSAADDPQAAVDAALAELTEDVAGNQASTPSKPSPSSAPAPAPETRSHNVDITRTGPERVEAVPPKEVSLPDTPEIRRILKLQVPIIVRLADKIMPAGEITQLAPGAIIEFNKVVSEELDLMINNKCVGGGQAVKVGEKFGLRVMRISPINQMILAMGGK